MYDERSTPLTGLPQATREQCLEYLRIENVKFEEDVVGTYWAAAALAGVDPVICIAQALKETGNFTSWWWMAHNNPAGINVPGTTVKTQPKLIVSQEGPFWTTGWFFNQANGLWQVGRHFDSAVEGILAHVGILSCYARDAKRGDIALWSRNGKAPQTHVCFNTVEHLDQLGSSKNPTGKGWAVPGTDYGHGIAVIANRIAAVGLH